MAPKRRIPRNHSNLDKDTNYWSNRELYQLYKRSLYKSSSQDIIKRRSSKRKKEKNQFLSKFDFKPKRGKRSCYKDHAECLTHWIKFLSWNYCNSCKLVEKQSLTPKSFNSKGSKHRSTCICTRKKYVVPQKPLIPNALQNLTREEEGILRLFNIDVGQKRVAPAGHRFKNGAFELRYRSNTAEERIEQVLDSNSKQRLLIAYEYLKNSNLSSYKEYLKHEQSPSPDNSKIKFWKVFNNMPAIECALWPVLYPYTKWCESIIKGQSKDSTLASFRYKLLSNVLGYNNNFELLQFHYDRWLFKTITGAVTIGKRMNTSPRRALETKSFTSEYWRWQHRFLKDAVLQHGNPSLFFTISPYEWDFPKPNWVERAIQTQDLIPTSCGAIETFHIAHTLEQLCKGYMTGCNTSQWDIHADHHLLYDTHSRPGNIKVVFFRFEYQGRRSLHVHMLVWLKSIANINKNCISATIPTDDAELAFLVDRVQASNTPSPYLVVNENPNNFTDDKIELQHTEYDQSINLRAYVPSVLSTLQSSMDVQASDGKLALMNYVSTYVTKLHDSNDSLRSTSTTPFQVAVPFLIDEHPGEPEMAMAFSNTSISYCNLSRYKLVPPVSEIYFSNSSIFKKYMERPSNVEGMSCLQFCREFVISKKNPTVASTNNLVGVKYKYIFSEHFFFQFAIVNTPFRNLQDIKHPAYDSVRDDLKGFSYMIFNQHEFLSNDTEFTNFLRLQNYSENKIKEFITFKDGLCFLFYKTLNELDSINVSVNEISLNGEQQAVYNHVVKGLNERSSHLNSIKYDITNTESDDDSVSSDISFTSVSSTETDSSSEDCPIDLTIDINSNDDESDFTCIRPTLLSGNPGTGKSVLLQQIVLYCMNQNLKVLLACPTAHQARYAVTQYEQENDITADTIHSLFKIPISSLEHPKINWSLMKFDVIIIDEVAMVADDIMQHVFKTCRTLPSKPYIFLAGDALQQQPLTTIKGRTTSGKSIFHTDILLKQCDRFRLYKVKRSECSILNSLLDSLRNHLPSHKQLDFINDLAFCEKGKVTEAIITEAFKSHPNATFLCISKKAVNYINKTIVNFLFSATTPLLSDVLLSDNIELDIFKGMKVLITRNLCKTLNIVNGETGTIEAIERGNIIIRNSKGQFLSIHKIRDDQSEPFYPLLPNYGITIFKVQGKTLSDIVVWFDNDIISPGAAYVAFSRVRCHKHIRLLEHVNYNQLKPIDRNPDK